MNGGDYGRAFCFKPDFILVSELAKTYPFSEEILRNVSRLTSHKNILIRTYATGRDLRQYFPKVGPRPQPSQMAEIVRRGKSIITVKGGIDHLSPLNGTADGTDYESFTKDGYHLHQLRLSSNCLFNCHYCPNLGSLNSPEFTIYTDVESMRQGIDAAVKRAPKAMFITGVNSDSFSMEWMSGHLKWLVPFIARTRDAVLNVVTRSASINTLMDLPHEKRTIFSMHIAPTYVIRNFEGGTTPSLVARVRAIRKLQQWGYRVALRFDPLIRFEGWQKHWKDAFKEMAQIVSPSKIDHYAMGALQMSESAARMCRVVHGGTGLFRYQLSDQMGDNLTYKEADRVAMYEGIKDMMARMLRTRNIPFFLVGERKGSDLYRKVCQ